jgi:hypothetical protein
MLRRLLFDENFNHRIVHGLQLRVPDLDFVIAQEIELKGAKDPELLGWAATENRIVVTHDVDTLLKFAYERIVGGHLMPGVIAVPQNLPIGQAIGDLVTAIECSEASELENSVLHLPL